MLDQNKVSNLITFYNDQVDEARRCGLDSEVETFNYVFNSFLECIECDPVFEEDHLVDIVDW